MSQPKTPEEQMKIVEKCIEEGIKKIKEAIDFLNQKKNEKS